MAICKKCIHYNVCDYSTVMEKEIECKDFICKENNEWISIEDSRKPKRMQDCLCICRLVEEETSEWDYCMVLKWHDYPDLDKPHFTDEGLGLFKVVYWRPLPKHPEKK